MPNRENLLRSIIRHGAGFRAHFPQALISRFIRAYFAKAAVADLAIRRRRDLAAMALGHGRLADRWTRGQCCVRAFNPDADRDGWGSEHTIVQVVSDDMPFLVDSVMMELNSLGYTIHLVIHPMIAVGRDRRRRICAVAGDDGGGAGLRLESFIHVEIDREVETGALHRIESALERVLEDVRLAVTDWPAILRRIREGMDELRRDPPQVEHGEFEESMEFLEWLMSDHFIFLGYREYDYVTGGGRAQLRPVPRSGLGILRRRTGGRPAYSPDALSPLLQQQARQPGVLILTKSTTRSSVHRPVNMDYIGITRFNRRGAVTGERRIYGLYTSLAYMSYAREIPLVRNKIRRVIERSQLAVNGYAGKVLLNILDTYPRDELLQATVDDLYTTAMGMVDLHERQRVRLFVRRDPYERFIACLVFVPRDKYHSGIRQRIQAVLYRAFNSDSADFSTWISQSTYAQLYLVIHTRPGAIPAYDVAAVERDIVAAARSWQDELQDLIRGIFDHTGGGELYARYGNAFPAAYQEDHSAAEAIEDLKLVQQSLAGECMITRLYRDPGMARDAFMFKIFSPDQPIPLSDALSILENMGLFIESERPYEIRPAGGSCVWVYDFGMRHRGKPIPDVGQVRDKFEEAFHLIRSGLLENDGFNRLVLQAGLDHRQVTVLRAYSKYLQQIGIPFSQSYIRDTLYRNPKTIAYLVRLFTTRFDPEPDLRRARAIRRLRRYIEQQLDYIDSLDEDRILRKFYQLIEATVRTNYFRRDSRGEWPGYLSFKLEPAAIPELPLPRPLYEIFVYSPRVEGVHLRGGRVARGGIRWSDRREDYRTEVLGLMKAQMVKNAIIVPVGAKGGFYVKRPPAGDRAALLQEGIECYRIFIRGLLDLTDNLTQDAIQPPPGVLRYDGDDPYLVVAADKGTATFSDIANDLALEYGFWLGDAFASGGAAGYDHKQMGITAKGAWESVRHHFQILGLDTRSTGFTVVGIGDMSGDVFGNGMLLSPHIRLVGAFNHQHIFLDPDPDPAASFRERRRLFNLPGSTWDDYKRDCISPGGGVHPRGAKSIELTEEVRRLLTTELTESDPNGLIRLLLCAPVDLVWNGGIGTYIKADAEPHADAGDKINDAVRVNASQVRCRVLGEGGNLGVTRRGRIALANRRALLNADWIDNSGGVACSDREVNIKILLNAVQRGGGLLPAERNRLLQRMTRDVEDLVLHDNYRQARAITLAEHESRLRPGWYIELIDHLEQRGVLARDQEQLPARAELEARAAAGTGLTRPEIAVLLSYAKITIYQQLLESNLPDEPYVEVLLHNYFPRQLQDQYSGQIHGHQLRREIIATRITNRMVNRVGIPFAHRLSSAGNTPVADIARAFLVVETVFDMHGLYSQIDSLDYRIDVPSQVQLTFEAQHLLRHASRWFLNHQHYLADIAETIRVFAGGTAVLRRLLRGILKGPEREMINNRIQEYRNLGVPARIGSRFAMLRTLFASLSITQLSPGIDLDIEELARLYFLLDREIRFFVLRRHIEVLVTRDVWEDRARVMLIQELYRLSSTLTASVLPYRRRTGDNEPAVAAWCADNKDHLRQYREILDLMQSGSASGLATISVAMDRLRALEGLINHRG